MFKLKKKLRKGKENKNVPGSQMDWHCIGPDLQDEFAANYEEGNGNPLQYSCLENPRDGGAWWAAVSGVAQSRTQLKRLSSSSSMKLY